MYGTNTEFHLSHLISRFPNFEQEIDIALSDNILNKIKGANFEIVKVSISSINEKNNQPITYDLLSQQEYPIMMDDGTIGNILIKNKFWINNGPLNMSD